MDLLNKKAIITGASDGIGREIALALAKEKATLLLCGRDDQRLASVKEHALELGAPEVYVYAFDLLDREESGMALQEITKSHTDLAIVINNAGIWHKPGDLTGIDHQTINQVIEVNLIAPIHIVKDVLPILKNQPEAAIVNISSRSGLIPQKGQSVYAASKYGLRGFTDVLREDLKETKVKVCGVYQGGTKTKIFKKADDDRDTTGFTEPEDLATVIVNVLKSPANLWVPEIHISK